MEDEINGSPQGMSQFSAQGPGQVDPGQPIQSKMDGGIAFATADATASKNLATFVKDANFGLPEYGKAARKAAVAYFDADEASKIAITGVVKE